MPARPGLVVDTTGYAPLIPQAMDALADLPWDDEPQPDLRYMIQGSYEKNSVLLMPRLFNAS